MNIRTIGIRPERQAKKMKAIKIAIAGIAVTAAGITVAPIASATSCGEANAMIVAHNGRYNINPTAEEAASYNTEAARLDRIADIACGPN